MYFRLADFNFTLHESPATANVTQTTLLLFQAEMRKGGACTSMTVAVGSCIGESPSIAQKEASTYGQLSEFYSTLTKVVSSISSIKDLTDLRRHSLITFEESSTQQSASIETFSSRCTQVFNLREHLPPISREPNHLLNALVNRSMCLSILIVLVNSL